VTLFYREYGEPSSGSPLVFLHGLFGSSANWGGIVKAFSETHYCIVPDLRNHGRSFHDGTVGYGAQSGDVINLLEELEIEKATLIGHSMGGKVAMMVALHQPEMVDRLVVVDMAPRRYQHSFAGILTALKKIDLEHLENRNEADSFLANYIDESGVRSYLLQNLVRTSNAWQWRINIEALSNGIAQITGFPVNESRRFNGPSLFIYGNNSDYVDAEGRAAISHFFPNAEVRGVDNAGHWVYADQPQVFINYLSRFLKSH
jgi:esterase